MHCVLACDTCSSVSMLQTVLQACTGRCQGEPSWAPPRTQLIKLLQTFACKTCDKYIRPASLLRQDMQTPRHAALSASYCFKENYNQTQPHTVSQITTNSNYTLFKPKQMRERGIEPVTMETLLKAPPPRTAPSVSTSCMDSLEGRPWARAWAVSPDFSSCTSSRWPRALTTSQLSTPPLPLLRLLISTYTEAHGFGCLPLPCYFAGTSFLCPKLMRPKCLPPRIHLSNKRPVKETSHGYHAYKSQLLQQLLAQHWGS